MTRMAAAIVLAVVLLWSAPAQAAGLRDSDVQPTHYSGPNQPVQVRGGIVEVDTVETERNLLGDQPPEVLSRLLVVRPSGIPPFHSAGQLVFVKVPATHSAPVGGYTGRTVSLHGRVQVPTPSDASYNHLLTTMRQIGALGPTQLPQRLFLIEANSILVVE